MSCELCGGDGEVGLHLDIDFPICRSCLLAQKEIVLGAVWMELSSVGTCQICAKLTRVVRLSGRTRNARVCRGCVGVRAIALDAASRPTLPGFGSPVSLEACRAVPKHLVARLEIVPEGLEGGVLTVMLTSASQLEMIPEIRAELAATTRLEVHIVMCSTAIEGAIDFDAFLAAYPPEGDPTPSHGPKRGV